MNLKWTWIEPEPEFCNLYEINTEILLYTFQMNEGAPPGVLWRAFLSVICLIFKYDLNSWKMNAVMCKCYLVLGQRTM